MRIDPDRSLRAGQLISKNRSLLEKVDDVTGDYLIFVFLAGFLALCIIAFGRAVTNGTRLFLLFLFALLLIAGWLTYRTMKQNRRLLFIHTGLSRDLNSQLSLDTIKSIDWRIVEKQKTYVQAVTRNSGFTWGQEITLIFSDGAIYVNCRNSVGGIPSARSPFDFGRCRQCVNEFRKQLDVIQQHASSNKSFDSSGGGVNCKDEG